MTQPILNPGTDQASLVYTSPSAITTFDPNEYGGCNRRWWYKYVGARAEPETKAQSNGKAVHDQIERYIVSGDKILDSTALPAVAHVPGGELLTEHAICPDLSAPTLTASGVPLVGYIDLLAVDRESRTAEIFDWKTTKSISQYAKTHDQVASSPQMIIYGHYAGLRWPELDLIGLWHVYLDGKTSAKRGRVFGREAIARKFERINGIVRLMRDVARVADPDDVEPNVSACDAWRGCPHRGYCSASQHTSLNAMFGDLFQIRKKEKTVTLLDSLMNSVAPVPGFAEAWAVIEASGRGTPPLAGAAGVQVALLKGHTCKADGMSYEGQGALALIAAPIVDPNVILQIAAELAPKVDLLPALTPPDAPAPTQPTTQPQTAPTLAEEVSASDEPGPTPAPKKRGRPPKIKASEPASDAPKIKASEPASDAADDTNHTHGAFVEVLVCIDCLPAHQPTRVMPLNITAIAEELAKQHGAVDVRCAPNDGPLGYGRWRGALHALIVNRARDLTPGVYYLDSRGDFGEIAAEAIASCVQLCFRGVR